MTDLARLQRILAERQAAYDAAHAYGDVGELEHARQALAEVIDRINEARNVSDKPTELPFHTAGLRRGDRHRYVESNRRPHGRQRHPFVCGGDVMRIDEKGFWLSKKELVALVAHASADELRPNQCLVVLDPAKNRAHATDGHRVAAIAIGGLVPADAPSRSFVPREDAARIARTPKAEQFLFGHGDGRVEAFDRRERPISTIHYVDAAAADKNLVVPNIDPILNDSCSFEKQHTEPAALRFSVNPRYLADLALAQAAADEEFCGEFRAPNDDLSALTWACGPWRVAIMQVRSGHRDATAEKKRVEWAKALAKAAGQ